MNFLDIHIRHIIMLLNEAVWKLDKPFDGGVNKPWKCPQLSEMYSVWAMVLTESGTDLLEVWAYRGYS